MISSSSRTCSPALGRSQSANSSCSSARRSFGIAACAASRIRTWTNRNASSGRAVERCGRISSLRTSDISVLPTSGRSSVGLSATTASRQNSFPHTDARSIAPRSDELNRSSRAASNA